MDDRRFDHIARTLISRRIACGGLLGSSLAMLGLAVPEGVDAKRCPKKKKRCGRTCIAKKSCCTSAQCRPRGSGKICKKGRCVCPPGTTLVNTQCAGQPCGGTCGPSQTCVGGECWPDPEEAAFVALINLHRQTQGQAPLTLQHQLGQAADLHSRDQATNNIFGHTGSDGSSVSVRIGRTGYAYRALGENVYRGGATASAAFTGWRNSPDHNDNMLGPNFIHVGIGRARSSTGAWYWTAVFASPD